jgi:cytochrome c oxidase cbb3-type subunit I/II
MAMLGVPYGEAVKRAPEMAREQARAVTARLVEQDAKLAGRGLETKEITALIAYLQRLGTDARGGGGAAGAAAAPGAAATPGASAGAAGPAGAR